MRTKFLGAIVILILALVVQLSLDHFSGRAWDLTLAVLITSAFFLDLGEILLLALWGFWGLSWQPGPSLEFWLFLLIPFAIWLARNIFQSTLWFANLGMVVLGILLFYFLGNAGVFRGSLGNILFDAGISAIFATGVFELLANLDEAHGRRLGLSERF